MREGKILHKVTAFVTRQRGEAAELLVFRHPTAGVQLPAGTVELGEAPEAAVLREAAEETGLPGLTIVRKLGSVVATLPADTRALLRMTKLFDAPASDASTVGGFGLKRGLYVRLTGEGPETGLSRAADGTAGRFAAVCYEEYDLNEEPPALAVQLCGYVRTSLLAERVERFYFHLATPAETAESWDVSTDNRVFRLYWTLLVPRPALIAPQQEWLDAVYWDLLASARVAGSQRWWMNE